MTGFKSQLEAFKRKTVSKLEMAVREIISLTYTQVVQGSPVDTGLFRGNWQTSIGSPIDFPIEMLDKTGAASIENMESILGALALGQTSYMTNNVPYAQGLEDGNSTQAPNGMVKLAVQNFPSYAMRISAKYGAI